MAPLVLLGVLSGSRERRRMGSLGSTLGVRVVYLTNASDDEARDRNATGGVGGLDCSKRLAGASWSPSRPF